MNDSKIEKIRAACSIGWAWKTLGLPGQPGRNCLSPFRQEGKPSFSVYMGKDCERWFDHGTSMKGDVIDFWALAKDISVQSAIDELLPLCGQAEVPKAGSYKAPEKPIQWPEDLRAATNDECRGLGLLRGLSHEAFYLAQELNTLRVGTDPVAGELLWYLTDAQKMGAEGKTFTGEGCLASKGQKTAALPGTKKRWPYGLLTNRREWDAILNIVLVEGMPDYFAALQLALASDINFRPVVMLGAGCNIGEDARYWLSGHKVLIIPHNDEEGGRATNKWVDQMTGLGARVLVQGLPEGSKDLNDFLVDPSGDNPLELLKGLHRGNR